MAQLHADFQEILQVKEEQEDVLHRRERELCALKGALKEEVETHDKEMTILRDEYEQELRTLIKDVEMTIEVTHSLLSPAAMKCFVCAPLFTVFPRYPSCLQEQRFAGSGEDRGRGGESCRQGADEKAESGEGAAVRKGAAAGGRGGPAQPRHPGVQSFGETAGAESETAGGEERVCDCVCVCASII